MQILASEALHGLRSLCVMQIMEMCSGYPYMTRFCPIVSSATNCNVQVKKVVPGRQVQCIEALLKTASSANDRANMLEELDTFNMTAQDHCPTDSAARATLEVLLLYTTTPLRLCYASAVA